jgi:hypothetical protein
MKTLRLFLILTITAGVVVLATAGSKAHSPGLATNKKAQVSHRSSKALATLSFGNTELDRDLQRAYAATAKYNSLNKALADGYLEDVYESGEGKHYFNPEFYDDGVFDIEHPEALLYVPDENGHLRLGALEYLVPYDPNAPLPPAPDGFSGSDDVWRAGDEGFPEWALNAWIWTNNPDGIFSKENPLVP